MLGFVSEYVPKSGALGLSLMGGAGMFSTSLILPVMGRWLDDYKKEGLSRGMDAAAADLYAGSETFMRVAIMPAILFVVFTLIYVARRKYYAAHKQAHAEVA